MKYVQCPRCRAQFHTGVIYESVEECSRCGAPLSPARSRFRARLRLTLERQGLRDNLDWEAITGSQYTRSHLATRTCDRRSGKAAAA